MQSLLILPLQRERTRRGGGSGESPHTAKGDGTSQEGRGDMKEGATTGGEREMITFMRTEHSIDFTQIQDILLH